MAHTDGQQRNPSIPGRPRLATPLLGLLLAVAVGLPRLPNTDLTAGQRDRLGADLYALGFFDWLGS